MHVCTEACKRWTVVSVATAFVVLGVSAVVFWSTLFDSILKHELPLRNAGSISYNLWKEIPVPIYIEFHFFNWTNAEEVIEDWSFKPAFEELGPYTFSEHHVRANVQWQDNGTLEYQQKRIWHYIPEKSNGSLDDAVTSLNAIAATVAYVASKQHLLVARGVDFLLKEKGASLVLTRTVNELIFEGYDDELLDLARKLNISNIDIPFEKFAWFAGSYDGNFTMYTGTSNISDLGIIKMWNGFSRTDYYEGHCADVKGSSGELWPPVEDAELVYAFSPDFCSYVPLVLNGSDTVHGLDGNRFVGDDRVFDNGTEYPDMGCFSPNVPSGIRNVSLCKFSAPVFISFPHFYLADSSYRQSIVGMHPNKSKHEFFVSLEPHTGLPLQATAQMQVNILIESISGIDMFTNVPKTYIPMLWVKQSATLTETYATLAKILLAVPSAGTYTGYGVLSLGVLLLVIVVLITVHSARKKQPEVAKKTNVKS